MIFPTRKSIAKGKSVKAVADFSQTSATKGKIAMSKANNVQLTNGLLYAGAFVYKDSDVLQYLAPVDGEQVALKSNGLTMGVRTFSQFSGSKSVVWVFDANQDTHIICSANATYKIFSGNISKISNLTFDSLAICQSRLFGLKGNRVYLSTPTEMTFAENLWIDLPSECVALVNNGELYAIGNDVYKLKIDAETQHIKIDKICSNVGDVAPDTVCAYGNKILFVASGKLLSLQHGAIKVLTQIHATPMCATMHQGLYYFSCYTYDDNLVMSYNPHSGKVVTMHHVSAKNMYSNGKNLLVSSGAMGFELADQGQVCYWKSLPINFDDNLTTKHLHRLVVHTERDLDVLIHADTSRTYHFKGKQTPQCMLISGYGKNITIELSANGQMCVKHLCLTVRTSEVSV